MSVLTLWMSALLVILGLLGLGSLLVSAARKKRRRDLTRKKIRRIKTQLDEWEKEDERRLDRTHAEWVQYADARQATLFELSELKRTYFETGEYENMVARFKTWEHGNGSPDELRQKKIDAAAAAGERWAVEEKLKMDDLMTRAQRDFEQWKSDSRGRSSLRAKRVKGGKRRRSRSTRPPSETSI